MKDEGILFECNVNIGVDITAAELLRAFDAIVLAGGSTIPRDLAIPGRTLHGVHFAMEFLEQQNKRVAGQLTGEVGIHATGKNVIVIGGGDTGSDCIGTSNRQHASSVTQFELLPKPPLERTASMPWPTYPVLLKTTSSHEEGAVRQWAITTKEFIGDEMGNLRALKIAGLEWNIPGDGQPAQFKEISGSEREIPCELALLAMGFIYPQREGLLDQLGVALDRKGNVEASEKDYSTNIPKVFAAGDMRRGQSLVVWAISEGRECARKVDEYLMGQSVLESKDANTIVNFQLNI
jgi:glutamate synthase (NADPH/NADH) small chain